MTKCVSIVPGHNGTVGAVSLGRIENDLTVAFSKKLASYLNAFGVNATVETYNLYNQLEKDPLRSDVRIYDYTIEIHFNITKGGTGSEIFVSPLKTDISMEQSIMVALSKWFKLRDDEHPVDGVKTSDFHILKSLPDRNISLLEIAFMDNEKDMEIYLTNIDEIAESIALAITKSLGVTPILSDTSIPAVETDDQIAADYYHWRVIAESFKSRNKAYDYVLYLRNLGIKSFVAYTNTPTIL